MRQGYAIKIFFIYLLVNLLTHLPFLNLPPVGTHVWRQCNTVSMSRNFAEEGMNIFEPKIDRRDGTTGITGSHFPLFEWTLALFYKIFGFGDWVVRLFSIFIFTIGMFAICRISVLLGNGLKMSIGSGFMLLSIPQFYYDGINAMPDIMAMGLSLWSAYYILKNQIENSGKNWLFAYLLALLGGIIKFQFLMIPFSFLLLGISDKSTWHTKGLFVISLILPISSWFYYAIKLTELNNLREYGLWIKPITNMAKLDTLFINIVSDLPELLIGWPLLIWLIYKLIKRQKRIESVDMKWVYLFWFIQFILFYIVAIERMKAHSYYFISLLPIFVLLATEKINKNKRMTRLFYLVILLNMTWSIIRIVPSRWVESKYQIPVEFINKDQKDSIQGMTNGSKNVIIGPDLSGGVFFYFTHTKGYSFADTEELIFERDGHTYIETLIKRGVEYLIIEVKEKEQIEILNKIELKAYKSVGNFRIYRLN